MRDFTNNEALIFIIAVYLFGSLFYSFFLKGIIEVFAKKHIQISFTQILISCLFGEVLATLISIILFKINPPPSVSKGKIGFEEFIQQEIDHVSFSLMLIIVFGIASSLYCVYQSKNKIKNTL